MPQYVNIKPDGSRETVKYRMKYSLTMKRIRMTQMARKLETLKQNGVISERRRKELWHKTKRELQEKFSPSLHRGNCNR